MMFKLRRDCESDPFPGFVVLTVSGVFVAVAVVPDDPGSLASWDMLLISGLFALVVGLRQARLAPAKLDQTLSRLVHRGALQGTPEAQQRVRQVLRASVRTWTRRAALVVAIAIFGAFVVAMLQAGSLYRLPLAVFETYWAYIAGWQLGRMAAYGSLGAALRQAGVSVRAIPGHLDGAAGLKPVGDLFFFQSTVAAIPAVYLAVWLFLIPVWPRDYSGWRPPYIPLLALSVVFEMLAFFLPMWFFHRVMRKEKELLLETADALSERVAALEGDLAQPDQEQPRRELQERLTLMRKQYWDIENMPTRPVDTKTRRHFTLSNVALVLPLLSEAVGLTGPWRRLMDVAGRLFG
jgi:hypothetical protein